LDAKGGQHRSDGAQQEIDPARATHG